MSDCSSVPVAPRLRCRQFQKSCGPPMRLSEILSWPQRYVSVLPSPLQSILQNTLLEKKLWVTSAFSGVGGWEIALHFLTQAVASVKVEADEGEEAEESAQSGLIGGPPLVEHQGVRGEEARSTKQGLIVYSAADLAEPALHVLRQHRGPSQAQHVFGDLRSRWPPATITQIEDLLAKARAQTEEEKDSELVAQIAEGCAKSVEETLQDSEMNSEAWCYKHHGERIRAQGDLVCHMASPVCKDHSLQNRHRRGALGKYACSWHCWLAERVLRSRHKQEDLVMTEIVAGHPTEALLQEALPDHFVVSFLLCPSQLGLPSRRQRKFTIAAAPWTRKVQIMSHHFLLRTDEEDLRSPLQQMRSTMNRKNRCGDIRASDCASGVCGV